MRRSSHARRSLPERRQASTRARGIWGAAGLAAALAAALAAGSADDSSIEQARRRAAAKVSVSPEDAAAVGRRASLRNIMRGADDCYQSRKFADTGPMINISRNSGSGSRPSASGVRY